MPCATEQSEIIVLRRICQRRGYRLHRCRVRDPQAIGFGRFQIVPANRPLNTNPAAYRLSLADVQAAMQRDTRQVALSHAESQRREHNIKRKA